MKTLPFTIKNLNAESIISLAKYLKSNHLLTTLNQEYEMLSLRSEIENVDNKARLNELQIQISKLEEESQNKPESSSLFENFDKQKIISERLEKLEKKRNSIKDEVYIGLRDEYLLELNDLNNEIESLVKQMEISREQTKPIIQVLSFQIEEMHVRKEIENLSEEYFQAKIKELNQELNETALTKMFWLMKLDLICSNRNFLNTMNNLNT